MRGHLRSSITDWTLHNDHGNTIRLLPFPFKHVASPCVTPPQYFFLAAIPSCFLILCWCWYFLMLCWCWRWQCWCLLILADFLLMLTVLKLASNYQGAALPPLGLHPPLPHSLHHTVHGYRHHQCQHNIFLKKIVKFNVKVKLNLNLKKSLNKNTLFPLFTLHTQHQHNLFTKEDIPIKTRTRIVLLMLIAIVTAGTRSHSQKIPRWSLAYLWKNPLEDTLFPRILTPHDPLIPCLSLKTLGSF